MNKPLYRRTVHFIFIFIASFIYALQSAPSHADIIQTQLAGNNLSDFPFFEYVKAFNANASIHVAVDPTRFPSVSGQTCDIYVVDTKSAAEWSVDASLTDVTPGGMQTESFGGATIQANSFQIAGPSELNSEAGTGLGVGYDVVLDCNQDGMLNGDDLIDGAGSEAGFFRVHDTTAAGPLAVTELDYNIAVDIGLTYGIPGSQLAENLFYPSNIALMGQLPIVIVSHGNGHDYAWYDHIGNHLASYGYIVMSHNNNTAPGPFSASTTTLGHTDAFIDQVETAAIAGGDLQGHLDTNNIVWIGHSRGAEGVAIGYDRLFDSAYSPVNYSMSNIRLISSMLPTDFEGTDTANPHDANYHLWTASGDSDVRGSADSNGLQTFHLYNRATKYRQSTVVQGTGHGWFHNGHDVPLPDGTSFDAFTGPCSIGGDASTPREEKNDLTHKIQLGYFLPLVKHYVEGNIPALDFLTRQYESFRPIGVPTGNPCIVVTHQYRNGAAIGNFVIDNYQSQPNSGISSSGAQVNFNVEHLTEDRLDDNNDNFTWMESDPFNGATQGGLTGSLTYNDLERGVVFDWTNEDRFYEWEIPNGRRDFTPYEYFSLRGAQSTRHPNTLAELDDLTFSVSLRDINNVESSININAYGGGLEQPYKRSGGWHNEMETVRIRLTDFLNNGSTLDLNQIVAVRLNMGPSWGSSRGRMVVDDAMLTSYLPPSAPAIPVLRISDMVLDYGEVELGFAFTKAVVIHNDGNADLQVAVSLSNPADPDIPQWSELNETSTVTISPGAGPLILQQTYEPAAEASHTIQMVVTSNDPSAPSIPVTLTGAGVVPVPLDTVLVLDRSGSMDDPAGDRIKIEALRDAAMLYTDLLRPDDGSGNGDKLGFWKYNHNNSEYMNLDFITEARKNTIETSELSASALTDSSRLRPQGSTGIGGTMLNAAAEIGVPLTNRKQVMVVLTDGIENISPYILNVVGPIEAANANLQMYSVGLGSNIEAGKLQAITNMGNEGYHQVSDSLAGESLYDLETFYFKIFSNATGMDLVVDPTHVVDLTNPTSMIIDRARIISSDRHANFLVLDDPALRRFYDLEFISPTGQVIVPGSSVGGIPVHISSRNTYTIYRIVFPDLSQSLSYVGDWFLRLTPNGEWNQRTVRQALAESYFQHSGFINPHQGLVQVGFAAAVASNYNLDVAISANNYLPGARVRLEATLSDRGWPAPKGEVRVKVSSPDDTLTSLVLYDDGTHGDVTAGDARWTNSFVQTALPGTYKFLFYSIGYNDRSEMAQREASRYATLKTIENTPDDKERPCIPCLLQWFLLLLGLLLLIYIWYCACYRKRIVGSTTA